MMYFVHVNFTLDRKTSSTAEADFSDWSRVQTLESFLQAPRGAPAMAKQSTDVRQFYLNIPQNKETNPISRIKVWAPQQQLHQ